MHQLIEKRHISYLTLKYQVVDLERKYQQQRQPQIIIPYVYNLITLFLIAIVIFILYVLESNAGSALWICGSIFAVIVPFIAYMLIQHQKKFLYYHILWNFLFQLSCSGVNYLYLYSYKKNQSNNDSDSDDQNSDSASITYGNLNEVDLLLYLFTHETMFIQQAFFIDSTNFLIDASLIIINRIINIIIFGSIIKQNAILNIFVYIVPILLIFNRYFRELIERKRFLENNNNSEWVNIIDNMYSTSLIVSRWDSRHQTIQLIRVSANAEAKYKIFNGETMKNFYSRIQLDVKNCDIQLGNIVDEGKRITLKDYLLMRCVHQEEQKDKKQHGKKKSQKLNHQLSQNLKQEDSLKQEFPSAKRSRCKSLHQRNLVESETLIGYYYRQAEDQNYSRIFRIKVSNFQMNDIALVTSVEDITYQDDIKYLQNSKIQSDKLLIQTLNDFRIKLIPIITGVGEFEKANLEEQYDNIVETIKYNTYLIMNHIYILFDYFSINEKKGVTIKMAQFSLKQMIWDIVGKINIMALKDIFIDTNQNIKIIGMFQAQAKINSVQFIHRNDVRRMDRTFSDERRIKQVLITVLSNALNMITQGSVTFKVGLDRNDQQLSQSITDSPTVRNHPSLKFEIEVSINQKKQKREDVSEKFEQLFKKIETQVIDELVKTLGPYQIKMEDQVEGNLIRISFAIYADFVNLRKEERLHSLIRPEISINYTQQQNQRQRATTRTNALTQIRQTKKSTESEPTGSSHLIQLGNYNSTNANERSPILRDNPFQKPLAKMISKEENKDQIMMDPQSEFQRQIDKQMQEFQSEQIKKQSERRNYTLTPDHMLQGKPNVKGQKRSTTIRHGTNILTSQLHQSFLSNLQIGGGDSTNNPTLNGSKGISMNENEGQLDNNSQSHRKQSQLDNSITQNKGHSGLEHKLNPYHQDTNNSFDRLSEKHNKSKSIFDWQTPSSNLIEDENLRPSEAVIDIDQKQNNNKFFQNSNFLVDSYIQNKFSTYFSQKEGSQVLLNEGQTSLVDREKLSNSQKGSHSIESSSSPQSPEKFIFMVNSCEEDTSQNYFLNDIKDSINEPDTNQLTEKMNVEIRVKKISIFSPQR